MRRRVLMVIPNLNFGGAQRVFHQHSEGLRRHHDVTECVFNRELGLAYPTGAPVESLEVPGGGRAPEKALHFAQRVARLRELKKRLRPDVSISHLEGADYVNVLSRVSERVVLCIHGTKVGDANISGWLGALRKSGLIPLLYRRADRVVTVSRAIREELITHFHLPPERLLSIPNGFELQKLQTLAHESLSSELEALFAAHPTVVTSGRLAVQKNQSELLEVFALLRKTVPAAKLVIVGDGELRAALLERCATLGLRPEQLDRSPGRLADAHVIFTGYQANPFSFVKRGTVFALTSGWEGFPMALGEAMAVGAPCVSVDCPTGPRELLSSGDPLPRKLLAPERTSVGALMPMLDGSQAPRAAWAQELSDVIQDAGTRARWSVAAVEQVRRFDLEMIVNEWSKVVEHA